MLYPAELRAHRPRPRSGWSGQRDSNPRPSAPKADALPDCAMPRPCTDSWSPPEPDPPPDRAFTGGRIIRTTTPSVNFANTESRGPLQRHARMRAPAARNQANGWQNHRRQGHRSGHPSRGPRGKRPARSVWQAPARAGSGAGGRRPGLARLRAQQARGLRGMRLRVGEPRPAALRHADRTAGPDP